MVGTNTSTKQLTLDESTKQTADGATASSRGQLPHFLHDGTSFMSTPARKRIARGGDLPPAALPVFYAMLQRRFHVLDSSLHGPRLLGLE